ncbi:DUF1365 family protein [Bradyrhizobium sp. sBnM-33]|uniref:DUF1365 family protein n=2 Tax=Bradyrhizobium sp. sBnM-33 TaxID=2831780 RepID=UPI00390C6D38
MLVTLRREKPDNYADAAAALYVGCLMHARLQPIGHRFSYRVTSLLIDWTGWPTRTESVLLCVNRAAFYSVYEACGRSHGRARPSIPAWRAEKSTTILRRRCPPVPSIEVGSIGHAKSG